jgi:hypothetical protein
LKDLGVFSLVSYRGYSQRKTVSIDLLSKGIRVAKIELRITIASDLLFIILAIDSDWWWVGPGFYGTVIAGIVNWWVYKQLL